MVVLLTAKLFHMVYMDYCTQNGLYCYVQYIIIQIFRCVIILEEELEGLMEEIMSEDLHRWKKADKNEDSKLSQDEFLSFQHPEHNEQSIEAMAEDLMAQMDDDRDLVR